MSSNQIPGVPAGWELVRIGKPEIGEWFVNGLDDLVQAIDDKHFYGCAIIRKIEKPARYRPFANAEEFKPHRDRWWRFSDTPDGLIFPHSPYNDNGPSGCTWQQAFNGRVFDDGTPFGVKIDE
jgi:hypothetical protein